MQAIVYLNLCFICIFARTALTQKQFYIFINKVFMTKFDIFDKYLETKNVKYFSQLQSIFEAIIFAWLTFMKMQSKAFNNYAGDKSSF